MNIRPHHHALLCCPLALCLFAGAAAVAQPFVGWQQLTERVPATPGAPVGGSLNQDIAVSPDGSKIAFVAAFDYTGQNTNGSQEIFVYDVATDQITMVTSREGAVGGTALYTPQWAPDNDTIIFRAGWNFPTNPDTGSNSSIQVWEVKVSTGQFRRITNFNPNIVNEVKLSADGTKVTFYSTANPVGTNAAGRNEAFIIDRNTLAIQQLTVHVGGFPNAIRPSADGSIVVFDSPGNFDGTNTNGSNEVWKVTPSNGVITAVTNNTSGGTPSFQVSGAASKSLCLDNTGRWIATAGSWNPLGNISGAGLFLYDLSTSPAGIQGLTTGSGSFFGPAMSGDARYIAIESNRTNLPGAPNTDGNRELFIYDRVAGTWTNSTNSTGGASLAQLASAATVNFASFSSNGRWLAYRSDASLEQGVTNVGGNFELYFGYISDTAAPQIGRGPAASRTLNVGDTLKLHVWAAGSGPLVYTWFRDGVLVSDGISAGGGTISGASTPRLTIQGVAGADSGTYTCTVSNEDGTVTSSASLVTVGNPSVGCSVADVAGGGADGLSPDGVVDGADFVAFINSFAIGDVSVDPVADVAGGGTGGLSPDGTIDGNDFVAFVNGFALGC